jgi:PAS domain S-box-containing protein
MAGLIPAIIFVLLIQLYGGRFEDLLNMTISAGHKEGWTQSETLLREQGETLIRDKARDIAFQLELVVRSVPWMTLRDLQRDPRFRDIAVQKVGQKGYTALHDSKTGIVRFHHDRKVENLNPRRYARNRPAFWSVIKRSLGGKNAGGYYDWLDTDGLTRKKYMYIVPVNQKTGDGVRLSVAAAADVDEFTQPVQKAQLVYRNSARYVAETVHTLIGSFRQAGLLLMGLAILVVSLLASLVGRYFSRTITELSVATSRVNEGDFNVAVKPPMSGEVGTLVDDFNRMVAHLAETTVSKQLLEASEDRLRKTNAELVREVAERARAEEALASEKERLDVTLRSIGEGVMTADREGTVVLINEMAEKLTGWSDEEARGQQLDHIYRTFDEATRDPGPNLIDTVLLEDGPVIGAQPRLLIARDGTELSIADNGAPVRAPDGAILGVVIVFRDVTEQRRMEEDLLRTRKLESLGILAGGIAHDFNNLLAVILGNIAFAKMLLNPVERAFARLTEAERASERGKELTEQLLAFARAGESVRSVVLPGDLIRDAASRVVQRSDTSCVFMIADDLFPVEVDEEQIRRAIRELIENAKEAMKGGTITVTASNITIDNGDGGPLPQGPYVSVAVTDEGAGMSAAEIERMFDPYFTTKEMGSTKGQGLGLSICYSIVRSHGGFITAESKPGFGTTIYVYLPAYTVARGNGPTEVVACRPA